MKNKLKIVLTSIMLMLFLVVGSFGGLAGCGKGDNSKTYNFIMTNATIPPVMASLMCLENGNETLMWYGRKQTFANVSKLGFDMNDSEADDAAGVDMSVVNTMSNKMMDLYNKSNGKAKFNLYVTDYGVEVAYKMFVANDIPEKNYHVYLMEDGTGAYTSFNQVNKKADFDALVEKVNSDLDAVKAGTYKYAADALKNVTLPYAYATRSNVTYCLQYPELLEGGDAEMKALLSEGKTIHFLKTNLTEKYNSLTAVKKETFKNAVFEKSYVDQYMLNANGKKTLVICGTSFTGEQADVGCTITEDVKNGVPGADAFEKVFDKIVEDYGSEYNIVIKPHPSWGLADPEYPTASGNGAAAGAKWASNGYQAAYEERVRYCNEKGIKVLPGQIPMEVLIWAYSDNIAIGGYSSSLYMNAPKNMTKFIINNNGSAAMDEVITKVFNKGMLADSLDFYKLENGVCTKTTETPSANA